MSTSYKIRVKPVSSSETLHRPYSWCYNHFGPFGIAWYINRYQNYDVYVFKNKEDYMLFALTWGEG